MTIKFLHLMTLIFLLENQTFALEKIRLYQDHKKTSPQAPKDKQQAKAGSFVLYKEMPHKRKSLQEDLETTLEITTERPHLVFDFTGAVHGFGDVVGVANILNGVQEASHHFGRITGILDGKSKEDLTTFYGLSLEDIKKTTGVNYVMLEDVESIEKADFIFETFYGGRLIPYHKQPFKPEYTAAKIYNDNIIDLKKAINPIKRFEQLPYYDASKTVIAIIDTMHGSNLSELRFPQYSVHFKPPGIGPERAGVFSIPEEFIAIIKNKNLNEKRQLAASYFLTGNATNQKKENSLVSLIENPDHLIAFFYGVHNEVLNAEGGLIGQTRDYLHGISQNYHQKKILAFTANSPQDLLKAGLKESEIYTINEEGGLINLNKQEEESIEKLANKTYAISLGKINGQQFGVLMAIADLPVLVEGNNSFSQVLRMRKPFILYRSLWNQPQILDLVKLEDTWMQMDVFKEVYLNQKHFNNLYTLNPYEGIIKRPRFEKFFLANTQQNPFFFNILNIRTPDFPQSLYGRLLLAEKYERVLAIKNTRDRRQEIIALSQLALEQFKDHALSYSLLYSAWRLGRIDRQALDMHREGVKQWAELENKFIPLQPRQSL